MFKAKSARLIAAGWLCVLLLVSSAMAAPKHCAPVGGTFMTNVGGFGNNTTLGLITGDIKGAVGEESWVSKLQVTAPPRLQSNTTS